MAHNTNPSLQQSRIVLASGAQIFRYFLLLHRKTNPGVCKETNYNQSHFSKHKTRDKSSSASSLLVLIGNIWRGVQGRPYSSPSSTFVQHNVAPANQDSIYYTLLSSIISALVSKCEKWGLKFKKHVLCCSAKHEGYFMSLISTFSTLLSDSA